MAFVTGASNVLAVELRRRTLEKTITLAMHMQATRSDKLNADVVNDTLLNTSTHFQILFGPRHAKRVRTTYYTDFYFS